MKNLLAILILVLAAPLLRAQSAPYLLSYQGHVTDSTGAVIGASTPTNRTVYFKLYADANSQTPLYAESQVVTISQGEFSVLIGNGAAISSLAKPALDTVFESNNTVVLGVSVASNEGANPTAEISPRQQLVAGAYAFRAKVAESVINGSITPSNLAAGSVGNGAIAPNGLDAVAIKDTSIVTGKIADSAITGGKIAGNTITASNLNTTTASGIGVWTPVANSNNIFRGTGNVGIGESAPNVPLTFASALGEKISFYGNDASSHVGVGVQPGVLQFYVNNASDRIGFGSGNSANFSEKMSIVPVTGRVGIGTASPTSMLDVSGGIKASGPAGFGFNSGDTDGGILSPSDGIIQVNTNGAQALRVGYGTITAPTLAVGNDAIGGADNCLSRTFQAYAGNLGSSPGNELIMGNFGCHNANDLSLGISAYRNTPGNDWTTAAILLGMNVDASPRSGGWIALAPSGVGIGTSTPRYPLEVQGSRDLSPGKVGQFYYNSAGGGSVGNNITTTGTYPVGIFCAQIIVSAGVVATSDERIKNVIGRSDAASDLAMLMQIEVTDYKYKDAVEQGAQPEKKVIAQQVEKVYPQAVGSSVGVVPDIYQQARMENGWVILATNLKIGDRVRLINDAGASVHEVREVAGGKFRTDLSAPNGLVFVFGREVKDLRFVDYEAIAMLNVSATQELLRKVQVLEARMAAIEARLPSGK